MAFRSDPPSADEARSLPSDLAARLDSGELRRLRSGWRRADRLLAGLQADSSVLDSAAREASLGVELPDAGTREEIERLSSPERASTRYEVRGKVGSGGMADVFRVFDRDLHRELAMKVLRSRSSGGRLARRFLAEARLTARLDHPGIVPVHDLGIDGRGRFWFTMPLVRGLTLREVFDRAGEERDGWTRARALEVILKVCDTLAFAHAAGVVHRDLKPSNVMVGRFGEAYVVDWGLARIAGEDELERAGDVVGTPAYMAPEQAAGRVDADGPRADIYSLGAILYHLLAGRPPYEGDRERDPAGNDVLAAVLAGPPDPLERVAPSAPPELVAVCRKAMERSPARRYREMSDLADDLRAWIEGRVVRAYASGAMVELRKWIGRNRSLATALGAAIVSAIAGLAAVSFTEARGRQEVLRLADARRLVELERRAEELWPAVPAKIPDLRSWLEDARSLAARRAVHTEDLAELQSEDSDDAERRWRTALLADLVEDLGRFADPEEGLMASVRARAEFAEGLRGDGESATAEAWRKAIEAIADRAQCPRYRGLAIRPQLGLLPIGQDPKSGLWEFACLASGEPPTRGEDGSLVLGAESAVVLVLVPPGDFEMGSKADSPADLAQAEEMPARIRDVEPFFLAKYELTRAQWERTHAGWPRRAGTAGENDLLPASGASWHEARELVRRLGLVLPNETQWEYAARADTKTPWWTGQTHGSLANRVNGLPDMEPLRRGSEQRRGTQDVDKLQANPFGLHHVHGNVAEWTESLWTRGYGTEASEVRSGPRSVRGGSYATPAAGLRSAARVAFSPDVRSPEIGLRPARPLE